MSVPALIETWWTRGEVPFPDSSTLQRTQQSWLWLMKEGLLNTLTGGTVAGTRAGASVWVVQGSSNGTTAALDGVDRWGSTFTPANLVRAPTGTAHSWIVLSCSATGVWLCIDYNGSAEGNFSISCARSAFTGGSITTKPTATNETSVGTTVGTPITSFSSESVFGVTYRFGLSVNSLGEFHTTSYRVGAGAFSTYGTLGNLRNQRAGDTWPTYISFTWIAPSGRGAGDAPTVFGSSVCGLRTRDSLARVSFGGILTAYTFGGATFVNSTNPDALDGSRWSSLPLFAYSYDSVPNTGYRGDVQDLWITTTGVNVGGKFPFTGAQTMVQLNNLLIPWGVAVTL
jgi:hypothetical protein